MLNKRRLAVLYMAVLVAVGVLSIPDFAEPAMATTSDRLLRNVKVPVNRGEGEFCHFQGQACQNHTRAIRLKGGADNHCYQVQARTSVTSATGQITWIWGSWSNNVSITSSVPSHLTKHKNEGRSAFNAVPWGGRGETQLLAF